MDCLCCIDYVVFRWRDVNQSVESVQNQGPTQEWTTTHTGMYWDREVGVGGGEGVIVQILHHMLVVAFIG